MSAAQKVSARSPLLGCSQGRVLPQNASHRLLLAALQTSGPALHAALETKKQVRLTPESPDAAAQVGPDLCPAPGMFYCPPHVLKVCHFFIGLELALTQLLTNLAATCPDNSKKCCPAGDYCYSDNGKNKCCEQGGQTET